MSVLNIVEPGGRGGVYQHVLGMAQSLADDNSCNVRIHTARDAECRPQIGSVSYCNCMRWERKGPRWWRRVVDVLWVSLVLFPHIFVQCRRGSRWEVQGLFGGGAYIFILVACRLRQTRLTFIPHNFFVRDDTLVGRLALQIGLRLCDNVVVFNTHDVGAIPSGVRVVQRKLIQYVPSEELSKIPELLNVFALGVPIVLFAGQLREDKNPELLLDALKFVKTDCCVVFAGEDKGAAALIRSRLSEIPCRSQLIDSYLPLNDLTALIRRATVVVCPYERASQSGIIALATQLGTPAIASRIGGLGEQTQYSFDLGEGAPVRLASLIQRVIAEKQIKDF